MVIVNKLIMPILISFMQLILELRWYRGGTVQKCSLAQGGTFNKFLGSL